jgi:hypothetical protein
MPSTMKPTHDVALRARELWIHHRRLLSVDTECNGGRRLADDAAFFSPTRLLRLHQTTFRGVLQSYAVEVEA